MVFTPSHNFLSTVVSFAGPFFASNVCMTRACVVSFEHRYLFSQNCEEFVKESGTHDEEVIQYRLNPTLIHLGILHAHIEVAVTTLKDT